MQNHAEPTLRWLDFEQMSCQTLYAVLKLRQDVFMLEQQSLYEDIDGHDESSQHLLLFRENKLCGYLRLLITAQTAKLQRIVLSPDVRGLGYGKILLNSALRRVADCDDVTAVKLSAQVQASAFYAQFGFAQSSEPYDDGGIMHIDMVRSNSAD